MTGLHCTTGCLQFFAVNIFVQAIAQTAFTVGFVSVVQELDPYYWTKPETPRPVAHRPEKKLLWMFHKQVACKPHATAEKCMVVLK